MLEWVNGWIVMCASCQSRCRQTMSKLMVKLFYVLIIKVKSGNATNYVYTLTAHTVLCAGVVTQPYKPISRYTEILFVPVFYLVHTAQDRSLLCTYGGHGMPG